VRATKTATGYKDSAGSRETIQPIADTGLRPAVKLCNWRGT